MCVCVWEEGGRSVEVSEHRHSRTTQPLCHKWVQFVNTTAAAAAVKATTEADSSNRISLERPKKLPTLGETNPTQPNPSTRLLRGPDVQMASSSCEFSFTLSLCCWGGGLVLRIVCDSVRACVTSFTWNHCGGMTSLTGIWCLLRDVTAKRKTLLFGETLNTFFALLHSPQ